MTDIRSPVLLYVKGFLFLLVGCLAGGILLAEYSSVRAALLLLLTVWAFCRAYYFAFYVIEHYIDPAFKFAGLSSLFTYWWTHGACGRNSPLPLEIRQQTFDNQRASPD